MAARVLICDNEDVLRALVRASLEEGDYEFLEAEDGEEAVELARREQPDLIVLDMMMPGKSGLEVLRELRTTPGVAETPVVMLTARAQALDREAAEQAGADHFVPKPFSPRELAELVASSLDRRP
ncbi:MAG TPA: response regulator [Gaiellaceae bacterium]|nr:response regulator [Gaiellaceae bacterium]